MFPSAHDEIPWQYTALVLGFWLASSLASTFMMVSQCAFFVRVSDKAIGGTYQTLLTTLTNLGVTWPRFFVLYLIDTLTLSHCETAAGRLELRCASKTDAPLCTEQGGTCITDREGFYLVGALCASIGVLLFFFINSSLRHLQALPVSSWKIKSD